MARRILKGSSILFVLLLASTLAFAYSPPTENGISWLTSAQNADGSWSSNAEFGTLDTSTVLDTLKRLNLNSPAYSNGVTWLSSQSLLPNDFLSRKIVSLYAAGVDTSVDLSALIARRNSDGGWSGDDDPVSMIQDTALALQALRVVNYADQNVISSALYFLTSNQNADGGWAFRPSTSSGSQGDPQGSNVFMTATLCVNIVETSPL